MLCTQNKAYASGERPEKLACKLRDALASLDKGAPCQARIAPAAFATWGDEQGVLNLAACQQLTGAVFRDKEPTMALLRGGGRTAFWDNTMHKAQKVGRKEFRIKAVKRWWDSFIETEARVGCKGRCKLLAEIEDTPAASQLGQARFCLSRVQAEEILNPSKLQADKGRCLRKRP